MSDNPKNLLDTIQKLNEENGLPWTAAHNFLTQESHEQLQYYIGYEPGPNEPSLEEREQRRVPRKPRETGGLLETEPLTLPTAVDWRNINGRNFVTPVKNQNFCSSCVAFAVTAAVETQARITSDIAVNDPNAGDLPDLSEAQLYFCSQSDEDQHNCFTGWGITPAFTFAQTPGIVPETSFPYPIHSLRDITYSGCNLPSDWQSQTTKISGYTTLYNGDTDPTTNLKNHLATKGPVVTGFTAYLDFLFYRSGVYIKNDADWNKRLGGHCVVCVGYDDDRGAWLCKNSWTTLWGDDGFVWFGYNQCGIDWGPMWGIDGFNTIYQTKA